MNGHHIVWTFERDYIHGRAVCDEEPGADCRLGPQSRECECEEWNILRDDDSAPYHFADGGDRSLGDRHYMTDTGECQVVLFLNEDRSLLPELCKNRDEFEIGRTQIEPVWNNDGYDWKRATS